MSQKTIQISVLLREVYDPKPPIRLTEDGFGISERGLRAIANPADLCALEQALCLAKEQEVYVTVFAVGSERLDDLLRLGLSMGAQRAVRVWHQSLAGGDTVANARLIERVLQIMKCEYFFTGSRLLDRGAEPAPALAAASCGLPCVSSVLNIEFQQNNIQVLRKSDRGAKQEVVLKPPCSLLFVDGCCTPRYPDQDALMGALHMPIEHWGFAELGLTSTELGSRGGQLTKELYSFPRVNPMRVVTPDPSLPAFDRILALLSGGIKPRAGKLHQLSAEQTADKLMAIFREQGLFVGESK